MKRFLILVLVLVSLVMVTGVASAEHSNIGGVGTNGYRLGR